MARDGYKIFDADTHVGPPGEILDRYLSAATGQAHLLGDLLGEQVRDRRATRSEGGAS
jgi:hypothetical protein